MPLTTSSTQALDGLPPRLRKLRKQSGLRIERIAVEIERSKQTIVGYENGSVSPPLASLAALADVYGVTLAELLGEEPA